MTSSGPTHAVVGQALVDFAVHGIFPDEPLSTRRVGVQDFGSALDALAAAKVKLQVGPGPATADGSHSEPPCARTAV
jgi:hypothetical protein